MPAAMILLSACPLRVGAASPIFAGCQYLGVPFQSVDDGAQQGSMNMIGYVTLGTNDLSRGARFYDAIAKELGVGRMMETERFIAWGVPEVVRVSVWRCRSMVSR